MITIDDIEAKAWHVAAEPAESRMEDLLAAVREFAASGSGVHDKALALAALLVTEPAANGAEAAPERASQAAMHATAQAQEAPEAAAEAREAAVSALLPEPPKVCTGPCQRERPAEDYSRDKSLRSGRRSRCRECESKARSERRLKLKGKAGLTQEDVAA